jgi:glycosyltransferase involved in cell wall biosynthesis
MEDSIKVSIIIPAYNEEKIIQNVINDIKKSRITDEIIVIDDGSIDNTYKQAKETGVIVLHHSYNQGYGAAIKTGIRHASGNVLLFIDADGQHKAEDIEKVIEPINEYDMVVGARSRHSKISFLRRFGKTFLKIYASYLAGMEIPDLNSGFRAVKKDVAYEFIHLYPNGFSLTTTITMACIFSGYSIKYVSIDSLEREGKSKIKPISDGINFFTTYNTDDNVIQSVKSIFTSNVSIIFPGFHFVDT